jgi:hypothetical protein
MNLTDNGLTYEFLDQNLDGDINTFNDLLFPPENSF